MPYPILYNKVTGEVALIGEPFVSFRGETHILTKVFPFDGMAGKIATDRSPQLYASVIDCEFRNPATGEKHFNR